MLEKTDMGVPGFPAAAVGTVPDTHTSWSHDPWLGELRHPTIVVPGKHDDPIAEAPELLRHATVLIKRGVQVTGLHMWGVSWSWPPERHNRHCEAITDDIDVLVTQRSGARHFWTGPHGFR